jgi:hypothetical protein
VPQTLEGENFTAADAGEFGEIEVTSNCTPTVGSTFTLTYRAEGPAFGPYTGTFTETGR